MERLNLISYLIFSQIFSLLHTPLHSLKTGQIKLMHIKAVALGKDLTSPDESGGCSEQKNTLAAVPALRNMSRREKRDLDTSPPSLPPYPKLTVSLASQSHYGDPAHSSMPQPLPAGSKQCRLHLGRRNGWLLDITLVSESWDRWHLTDV